MDELPKVNLVPADRRDSTGDTHFGGSATFIQGDYTPDCCGKRMVLLAQLDSLDYPEAKLPDSALIYVFVCQQCYMVHAELQCA